MNSVSATTKIKDMSDIQVLGYFVIEEMNSSCDTVPHYHYSYFIELYITLKDKQLDFEKI